MKPFFPSLPIIMLRHSLLIYGEIRAEGSTIFTGYLNTSTIVRTGLFNRLLLQVVLLFSIYLKDNLWRLKYYVHHLSVHLPEYADFRQKELRMARDYFLYI